MGVGGQLLLFLPFYPSVVTMSKSTGRTKCFNKRDKWMKRLGFGTYQNYLRSNIWKEIRSKVLEKRRHKCHFCGGKANEVHHLRYTKPVLLAEGQYWMGGLVATCRTCHQMISDLAKKEKIHEHAAFIAFNIQRKKQSLLT